MRVWEPGSAKPENLPMNSTNEAGDPMEREAKGRLHPDDVPSADEILDVVGLFCPVPISRTAAQVRRMEAGRVLEIRADDPVTLIDLPNWCSGTGHRYAGWIRDGEEWRIFVEVRSGRRRRLPGAGGTCGP